jgi:hypothetical protein
MKVYTGSELVKAGPFLQQMQAEIDRLPELKVTRAEVGDRSCDVFLDGEIDGRLATVQVTVFKAKSYHNRYLATMDGKIYDSETNSGYMDPLTAMVTWLHSICKLDTEEARDGRLVMRPEEWDTVHADFIKHCLKTIPMFIHKPEIVRHTVAWPWDQHPYSLERHHWKLRIYDKDLRDFRLPSNLTYFYVSLVTSYDTKKLWIVIGPDFRNSYNEYEILKRMFPDAVTAPELFSKFGRDNTALVVECDSPEMVAKEIEAATRRLDDYYDDVAKENDAPRDWHKAVKWTEEGPVYLPLSPEQESLERDRYAKQTKHNAERKAYILERLKAREIDLEAMLPGATISYENGMLNCKFSYRFPKVDGGRVKWRKAEATVQVDFSGCPGIEKESYTIYVPRIAKYQTMRGVYDDFQTARENDATRDMMIKPAQSRASYWYEDNNTQRWLSSAHEVIAGIKALPGKIKALSDFVQYKGLRE